MSHALTRALCGDILLSTLNVHIRTTTVALTAPLASPGVPNVEDAPDPAGTVIRHIQRTVDSLRDRDRAMRGTCGSEIATGETVGKGFKLSTGPARNPWCE